MKAAVAAAALAAIVGLAGACGHSPRATDPAPIPDVGQQTPEQALRAFVRAAELGRYDLLLRLAPSEVRRSLTPEVLRARWEGPNGAHRRALLPVLRGLMQAPIVVLGDDAFLPYTRPVPPGQQVQVEGEVRFTREELAWKIADAW